MLLGEIQIYQIHLPYGTSDTEIAYTKKVAEFLFPHFAIRALYRSTFCFRHLALELRYQSNLPEKSVRPLFLVENKASPPLFFLKKSLRPPFFS